jgi:L-malate glycosyltransferase
MKVLHLTISLAPGGRRSAILTLASHLQRLGVNCELGCLHELECSPEEAAAFPSPVTAFEKHGLWEPQAIARLTEFCLQREVDVVHTHDAESQLAGALMRQREPRIKLVKTFHRSLPFDSATSRDRLRNAFASAFCGAIVTGSSERRRHFLEQNYVRSAKLVRIPFGIDLERFHPDEAARNSKRRELGAEPSQLLIGVAGHFGEEKGVDVAIRSFQELCRVRDPNSVILLVIGNGTAAQAKALRALAARSPQCRILFAGFVRDIEQWLPAMDLFLHTPRLEAFGLVLAESMATGLPVVATRVGGIPEIVKDTRTGLLVEPDSHWKTGRVVAELLADPERCAAMGAQGRNVALAEFSGRLYAERHMTLYETLLKGGDLRRALPGGE